MAKVIVYTKTFCPYCVRAKSLLDNKGAEYEEILLETREEFADLKNKTGMMTVPQIFIDDQLIGGFTELAELDAKGGLDPLLK